MITDGYRFSFKEGVDLRSVADTLLLSLLAAEGIYGAARVRMDSRYTVEPTLNVIVIDGSTQVGAGRGGHLHGLRHQGVRAGGLHRPAAGTGGAVMTAPTRTGFCAARPEGLVRQDRAPRPPRGSVRPRRDRQDHAGGDGTGAGGLHRPGRQPADPAAVAGQAGCSPRGRHHRLAGHPRRPALRRLGRGQAPSSSTRPPRPRNWPWPGRSSNVRHEKDGVVIRRIEDYGFGKG